MITIDENYVNELGLALKSIRLASDFPQQISPQIDAPKESAFLAFLWASSICHSTKGGLRGYFKNTHYNGWDYLLRAFCASTEDSLNNVSVENIKKITKDQLRYLLVHYAREPEVNLNDIDKRALILNKCAKQLEEKHQSSINLLLEKAKFRIGGNEGAYSQLAKLDAFKDPLRKKSSAFLMTIHFSGFWRIIDQENVLPMIDYHRMRVLCRMGCIKIEEMHLIDKLINRDIVTNEIEGQIRGIAAIVLKKLVGISGMAMFDLDTLVWSHARSCCRNHPLCISGKTENASFYNYIQNSFNGKCVFQDWCPGYKDTRLRNIWEPIIQTEFY